MPNFYAGRRLAAALGGGEVVVLVFGARGSRKLDARFDLYNHSPTGFEWGYSGSGPAQLALALCADVLGSDEMRALRVYQRVKEKLIAPIQADFWSFTEQEILDAIERAEHEQSS